MTVHSTQALLEAMSSFRAADSLEALLDDGPELIGRLGFDRVLISRVDEGVWVPESMHVRRDAAWAAAIVEAGRDARTVMRSVVECDVVDAGKALVVAEVQTHPRVHRDIAVVSRSDNYAVVPITVGSAVLGMVHADCYFQQRDVTRDECDLLRLAAEGLAAHVGRVLLLEGLRHVEHGAATSWTRAARGRPGTRSEHQPSAQEGSLTVRERDVIRLMAAGETNYAIARRLSVSEGTVKTHVSHILQKLQAANRAQAVSRWLHG